MKEHPQAEILRAIADGKTVEVRKELTPHPHADILRAIADGKKVQTRLIGDDDWWEPAAVLQYIDDVHREFRIKPETMTLAGHEFPAPAREPLEDRQEYWAVCIDQQDEGLAVSFTWWGDETDLLWLKRGLIQLTEEGAIAQAKAMIAAIRGEV